MSQTCTCVCVCACVCVYNDIVPFSRFSLSHNVHKTYVHVHSFDFFGHVRLFSVFICAGDVASCGLSDSCVETKPLIFT